MYIKLRINTGWAAEAPLLVPSVYRCRKAESSASHWIRTADQVCRWLSRVHSSPGSMCPTTWARHHQASRGFCFSPGWPCPPRRHFCVCLPEHPSRGGMRASKPSQVMFIHGTLNSPRALLCKPFQGCYRASKRLRPSALI